MIASLSGELKAVHDDCVHLQAGAIVYELLVTQADAQLLHAGIGQDLTFHTILYLEGDAARGNLEPRLIGFLRADDKRFFEMFTTVKGIGPKTALRAFTVPIGEIAEAIEARDTRYLTGLKGVGKRTAELIVAELAGKVATFATTGARVTLASRRSPAEEDAIAALLALGERRAEAEELLERAKHSNPSMKSTDGLVREMLRARAVRA